MTKVCTKCSMDKSLNDYYVQKSHKDGRRSQCKSCMKHAQSLLPEEKKIRQRLATKKWTNINRELCRQRSRDWQKNNRERAENRRRKWYEENKARHRQSVYRWRMKNIDHVRELNRISARKSRKNMSPQKQLENRIHHSFSLQIRRQLKAKKDKSTFTALGYSIDDLKNHLERLFLEGMSWQNYGKWEIDHIRPRVSFNITSSECDDFKECWSLSNLRPLWAIDNRKKGSKWAKH